MQTIAQKSAAELADRLYRQNVITASEYEMLTEGINEIELLRDRDETLEDLWAEFRNVPTDPENGVILAPFYRWGKGIATAEILHWFDARHSKGSAYLMYRKTSQGEMPSMFCFDCESRDCAYNHDGVCRFVMVHGRPPRITEKNGCEEGCIDLCANLLAA